MMKNIVIIGGGAAGLMAAISAGKHHPDADITLLERNNITGKKLLLTGGGRCNITSALPMEEFKNRIPENGKFLYSAFSAFSNKDLMTLLEGSGLKLKREGHKIYPARDSAQLVVNALMKALAVNTQICYGEKVTDIQTEPFENGQKIVGIVTDRQSYPADKVIIATGGMSYPATGSDGTFFSVLRKSGVEITPLYPSLVQMYLKEDAKKLRGISVRNVFLNAKVEKKVYQSRGDMLFTERGISGPAVMDMSSYLTKYKPADIVLRVDFLPQCTEQEIRDRIFDHSKKKIENKMDDMLPHRLLESLYSDVAGVDLDNMKKPLQEALIHRMKGYSLTVTGFGSINESIVTKGGVCLKQINPSTLEHKKIRGLFFAGECLDLDALTGGYNLQIAFSTGYLAGK